MKPNNLNELPFVIKPWGKEVIVYNDSEQNYCGKFITVNRECDSSLHFHRNKHETFLVVRGVVVLEIYPGDGQKHIHVLHPGDTMVIPAGVAHRFRGAQEVNQFVEFSTHHDDADVYRIHKSSNDVCVTTQDAQREPEQTVETINDAIDDKEQSEGEITASMES
jgi:mannose-6-phosphate isomerase-like protein (cupin superfamily)